MVYDALYGGVITRIVGINMFPGGVDADEAYAGYEAYSILKYGFDSNGYVNPVYLTTWGSGMSAMNTYLMIPFIAVLGKTVLAIRLPQAVLGVISLYFMYRMVYNITEDEKIAKWSSVLLLISPWHIIGMRYALDCNMVFSFLIISFYFLSKIKNDIRWLIASAVSLGLTLYCYAAVWILIAILWIGICVFLIKNKKNFPYIIISSIIIFLIASPLLMFVLVNMGIIPEIKSIISIPKLTYFRSDELAYGCMENLKKLIKILIFQRTYAPRTSVKFFGIYYVFSTPLLLVGIYSECRKIIAEVKIKKISYSLFLILWTMLCIGISLFQGVEIHRINYMYISLFIYLAIGMVHMSKRWGIYTFLKILYTAAFILFICFYLTSYQKIIGKLQNEGAKEAVCMAEELVSENSYEKIVIKHMALRHSQVLFYTGYPTDDYLMSVKYDNTNPRWRSATEFGNFIWDDSSQIDDKYCYIISKESVDEYISKGFNVAEFENMAVAYSF